MGYICTSGFELQELHSTALILPPATNPQPDGGKVDNGTGTGNWIPETTIVRSGSASRAFPDGYLTCTYWPVSAADGALGNGLYAEAWFYPTSSFTNTRDIVAFAHIADGVPLIKAQWKGSTQQIGLFYGGSYGTGTQVGSYSDALSLNAWHKIGLYAKIDTGAVDECALRVRGDVVASGTGLDIGDNIIDTFLVGVVGVTGTAGAAVCYFDDVVCSTFGFVADHTRIVYLPPASDVQVGKWLRGAGGSTNLRQAVNSVPPAGLDSASKTNNSQIKSDALDSNVDGPTETYQVRMRTYRTAGIPGGHMVSSVQLGVCHGEDVAGGTKTLTTQLIGNPIEGSAFSCTAGNDAGACGTYPTNWAWDRTDSAAGPVDPDVGPLAEIASTTASNALIDVCSIVAIAFVDDRDVPYQHARTTRRTHRSPRLRR